MKVKNLWIASIDVFRKNGGRERTCIAVLARTIDGALRSAWEEAEKLWEYDPEVESVAIRRITEQEEVKA